MFRKVSSVLRSVLYFLLFCIFLCSCSLHDHEWQDATCTAAKICNICGNTGGDPLGHQWVDATCTAPKTCSVCGETEGKPIPHKWSKATCTEAKTCSVCGETSGEPLGHYPSFLRSERQIVRPATCQSEGIEAYPCIRCDFLIESTFQKASHTYGDWQILQEPTFDSPEKKVRYCTVCGEELDSKLTSGQPTPTDINYSLERYNLIRRSYWVNGQRERANTLVCEVDKPLGYIVLFTEAGGVVGRFIVDGKVSSLNSFLSPD